MGGPLRGCNRPVPDPDSPPPASPAGPVDFALAPALRLRLLGSGLVAIGLVVALGVLVTWVTDLPTAFVSGLVVLGARRRRSRWDCWSAYATGCCGSTTPATGSGCCGPPRPGRPGGPTCSTSRPRTVSGTRCVVLRLRDGRTTALPVDAIEGDPVALTEALTTHLDRGHGYRRLR